MLKFPFGSKHIPCGKTIHRNVNEWVWLAVLAVALAQNLAAAKAIPVMGLMPKVNKPSRVILGHLSPPFSVDV
jgi:hypothetical protein